MNQASEHAKVRKGFAKVPHEVFFNGNFSIYTYAVFCALKHHTDKSGMCYPSHETIANYLNIGRTKVIEAIKVLRACNILTTTKQKRSEGGLWRCNTYFIHDQSAWKLPAVATRNTVTVSSKNTRRSSHHKRDAARQDDTNKNHIEQELVLTNAKGLQNEVLPNEVNSIIKIFQPLNATNLYENKTQRDAALKLVQRSGFEEMAKLCRGVVELQGKQYMPTVTTPQQLLRKWGEVGVYLKRSNNSKVHMARI